MNRDHLLDTLASICNIEKSIIDGLEETSMGIEPVEYYFTVEISRNQCLIHRDVLPQYFGTEKDFLNLYDCRNTDKWKACQVAVKAFEKWAKGKVIKFESKFSI